MARKGKQPALSFSKILEINSALDYYYRHHGPVISGDKLEALYEELVGSGIHHGYDKTKQYKIHVRNKSVFVTEERLLPAVQLPVGLSNVSDPEGPTLDSK